MKEVEGRTMCVHGKDKNTQGRSKDSVYGPQEWGGFYELRSSAKVGSM